MATCGRSKLFDRALNPPIAGRRANGFGGYQKLCGTPPDLTTLANRIANRCPCVALCGKSDLMDRIQTAGGDVFFARYL